MPNPDRLLVHTLSSQRERLSKERREERFERLYRRLDERHERVKSIYTIEEKLRRQPFHLSYGDAISEIGEELSRVDASALYPIVTAVDHFLLAREIGKEYHSRLEDSILEDFEGFSPMTDPRLVGDLLFQDTTGEEPKGKVLFEYREGCFQVHFSKDVDYNFFEHKACGTPLETSDSQSCGLFIPDFAVIRDSERFAFPLILINDLKEKQEEQDTRTHEEQHFASRVSFLINELNQAHLTPQQDRLSSKESDIKDEILAFTREGKMGRVFLEDYWPAYLVSLGLKDPKPNGSPRPPRVFSLRERGLIQKEIRFISNRIADSRLFKFGPRGRAFLVSHLYDVPLRQFSAWIDILDSYYRDREGSIQAFLTDLKYTALDAAETKRAKHLNNEFRKRRPVYLDAVLGVTEDGSRYDWRARFQSYIQTGQAF